MQQSFELIAKTFQGLEEVLAQELTELGAEVSQIGRRMVSFQGNQEMMYRANFCLRTAVRVLKPIKHFKAKDPDQVYAAVKSIDWSEIFDVDTTFAVDTTVYSTEFRNSKFVAYKVKDAIVDYFMETQGKRPNVKISNPDLRLNMHISDTDCTLSLDSSGESLHLRGYREASVEAPINEVLAAAIIKMSGWKGETDLIDPFCGSGTLLIEAALIARNIYPGVFRKRFGFEAWKDFDADLLHSIFEDDSQEREFTHKIYGYDINVPAIEATRANAKAAGVADCIVLEQRDVRAFTQADSPAPVEAMLPALIVSNPPYGERLRPSDLEDIYRSLGAALKRVFKGCEAYIISSKEELFDAMRLRPSLKTPLQNGSLDCELRKFVLFDGKLENFREEGGRVKTEDDLRRMGEKGRFRDGRKREFSRKRQDWEDEAPRPYDDEARPRRDTDYFDDEEQFAAYRNLRARHNTFERVRSSKENRERRSFGRDRRHADNERSFDRRDRGYDRKERGFERKERGYDRRDGGFGRSERKPFQRDGQQRDRREEGFRREGGFRGESQQRGTQGKDGFQKGGFKKSGFDRRDRHN